MNEFVTYEKLIFIVLGSSGLLTFVFTLISKYFDKNTRVAIMKELKEFDKDYRDKLDKFKDDSKLMESGLKDLIVESNKTTEKYYSEMVQKLIRIEAQINNLRKD